MADTTSDTPDLIASTGINDPNSIWATGLLQTAVQGGLGIAQTAVSSALQHQTPVPQNNGTPATPVVGSAVVTPTSPNTKYLLWGLVAAGAALLLYVVFGGRK